MTVKEAVNTLLNLDLDRVWELLQPVVLFIKRICVFSFSMWILLFAFLFLDSIRVAWNLHPPVVETRTLKALDDIDVQNPSYLIKEPGTTGDPRVVVKPGGAVTWGINVEQDHPAAVDVKVWTSEWGQSTLVPDSWYTYDIRKLDFTLHATSDTFEVVRVDLTLYSGTVPDDRHLYPFGWTKPID